MAQEMNVYQNPLVERYASREMLWNFSPQRRYEIYRDLWIALAESQKELGLPITDEQIAEMREHRSDIDFDLIAEEESRTRHDVMAHIRAFGAVCPRAKPIIHLGATSAFVGDNADLIQMRDGMKLIKAKLVSLIAALRDFALRTRDIPTLGFTHFQPAQPTTVGKRATLWIQDFVEDLRDLDYRLNNLKFRGVKGTTGTQASFLKLFDGDADKVRKLDMLVTEKMGFRERFPVTGQTYPRKVDYQVLSLLSGIAQSAHKFSNDIRLLQHLREIEEPFGSSQVGSSAMAYKRNPMRSERIGSLARYVIALAQTPAWTAATQWLERTLDDSANKRLSIPEAFLATDSILILGINVSRGLNLYEHVIRRRLKDELPFIATEDILMEAVKKGGDRQELHEKIRRYSMDVALQLREGGNNDLLDRIAADRSFGLTRDDLREIMNPERYVGLAPIQVDDFIGGVVDPILAENSELIIAEAKLKV